MELSMTRVYGPLSDYDFFNNRLNVSYISIHKNIYLKGQQAKQCNRHLEVPCGRIPNGWEKRLHVSEQY